MSYTDYSFNGNWANIPLKKLAYKWIPEDRRGYISVRSENEKYIGTFYAHPNLPVWMIGKDTRATASHRSDQEWGIVLTRGTVVSLQGITPSGVNGLVPGAYNENSGSFPVNSTVETAFGVPDGIDAWLVPCNGGVSTTYTYTAYDEEVETMEDMTGTYASAGDTITLSANYPVGVLVKDNWQSKLLGEYLNRSYLQEMEIMIEGTIEVPFYSGNKSALVAYLGSEANRVTLSKRFTFGYGTYAAGTLVQSDDYGKFVLDSSTTLAQKIGRALTKRVRGPLAMNDAVQAHMDLASTSDKTMGWPSHLFWFVYDAITMHNGSVPSDILTQISAEINAGNFALVRIMVDLG